MERAKLFAVNYLKKNNIQTIEKKNIYFKLFMQRKEQLIEIIEESLE